MKILHVGLLKGGVDAYFRIILSHIGCDFDFVAVRGAYDGYMPYVRNGQEIKTYRTVARRSLNPLRDVWALLQVLWIIAKEHPDLIHCHSAKGGVNGLLVPMDPSSFADAICELLEDDKRRSRMGRNARKLFETEFMVGQRIRRLEEIYTAVYQA